jgi:hypothetical protein
VPVPDVSVPVTPPDDPVEELVPPELFAEPGVELPVELPADVPPPVPESAEVKGLNSASGGVTCSGPTTAVTSGIAFTKKVRRETALLYRTV